jgi:hypothetical protein
MCYLEFTIKNYIDGTLDINYFNQSIANMICTKLLRLVIDDTITWDNHTDQLISRLNAVRAVQAMLPGKVLKMLYFSYVHSVISYSIIFWGIKIFRMHKIFNNYN